MPTYLELAFPWWQDTKAGLVCREELYRGMLCRNRDDSEMVDVGGSRACGAGLKTIWDDRALPTLPVRFV